MNNFISTEKSLKRWLKNRVTVTTATVVGFLIMGTAVFAMNVNGKAVELTENGFELTQEYIVGKQSVNGKTAGAVVSETVANEKLTISKVLENKTENAESWLLSVQGGENGITTEIGKDAVLSGKNLDRTTLNLWGKTTTTNNGIIEKAQNGWAAMTISGAKEGVKATFTNNGTVKGDINVEDNVELTNTGVIEGKIYADKAAGNKAITLSGKDSKVGAIELQKGETTNNTLTITNGVNDTIDNVAGLDKITVDGSDVIISAGEMKTALKNGNGLVDINDSNVDINVNIEGTGDRNGTSSLIQNYGKTKGEYKLTNRGNLISEKAQNVVYTNAASDVKMTVENSGNITLGTADSAWGNGLVGKFDSGVSNAEISIINTGIIKVQNAGGMDITNKGQDTNKGTLLNNGTIEVLSGVAIIADGAGITGTNAKDIKVTDAGYGLKAANGATVINEGTITLVKTPADKEEAGAEEEINLAAVILGEAKNTGGIFINAGNIEAGNGAALVKVETVENSAFINREGGKVTIGEGGKLAVIAENTKKLRNGEGSVFKINNAGEIELKAGATGADSKIEFVNEAGAKLVLGEKAVLGAAESSFTNAGTAEFGQGAKIAEDADFQANTGVLRVSGVDFSKIDSTLTGDELIKVQLQKVLETVGVKFGDGDSTLEDDVLKQAIGIITAYDEKGNEVVKIVGGDELQDGIEGTAQTIFGDGADNYKIAGVTVNVTGGETSGKVLNIISKDTPAGAESSASQGTAGILNIKDETTLSDFVINIEDTELTKGSGIVLTAGVAGDTNVLTLKDSTINGDKAETAITLNSYTTLKLDNTTVLGNIGNGNKGGVETLGNTTINGIVKAGRLTASGNTTFEKAVTIGSAESNGISTSGTTWFKDMVETTGNSFMKTSGTTQFDKDVKLAGALATDGTTIFNGTLTTSNKENTILGETFINGKLILGGELKVGDGVVAKVATDATGTLVLDSKAEISAGEGTKTITVNEDGKLVVKVGTEKDSFGRLTENAFNNASETEFGTDDSGIKLAGNGEIQFTAENFTGKDVIVAVDKVSTADGAVSSDLNITTDSDIYVLDKDRTEAYDGVVFTYDTELFEDNVLNNINNQAYNVGSEYLSQTKAERQEQLDKLYSSNIYAETVRASYDMFKLNEDTVLSMNTTAKTGELVAEGKALYSKTEYDRDGRVADRTSENETTGLLANLVYGIDDNTSLGFVFSGAKQDIDTDGGSADGDAFYFGVYKDTIIGKAQVRTGAAYQLNKFDADNKAGVRTTDASYDSNAYGVYSQATFTNDLGNGLLLQPKLRAGFTHIEQEAVKDAYFGLDDAEITTFDLTVGADLVKSVQFEKAAAEFKLGADYTYAMGDTDKEFTGSFKGGTESFDVLGAEIAENVFSINLGAEVSYENGFFYNGGFTYEFGSNDTEAYGVNVGAGYKF